MSRAATNTAPPFSELFKDANAKLAKLAELYRSEVNYTNNRLDAINSTAREFNQLRALIPASMLDERFTETVTLPTFTLTSHE